MKRTSSNSGAILAAIILIATASMLSAQVTTATVLGTVTDASGAAIADSTVQVRNLGNGRNNR